MLPIQQVFHNVMQFDNHHQLALSNVFELQFGKKSYLFKTFNFVEKNSWFKDFKKIKKDLQLRQLNCMKKLFSNV